MNHETPLAQGPVDVNVRRFGAPCCLICYGKHNVRAVLTSGIDGVMVFDA